jgi:hypothetical protein
VPCRLASCPNTFSGCGRLPPVFQSFSVKGFICKTEITCVAIAEVGWKIDQEFCVGRGKVELENVSKSLLVLKCHFGLLPKECGGMSVIWC